MHAELIRSRLLTTMHPTCIGVLVRCALLPLVMYVAVTGPGAGAVTIEPFHPGGNVTTEPPPQGISPSVAVTDNPDDPDETSWDDYKEEFGKSYTTPEEDRNRRAIYYDNVRRIAAHNWLYDVGEKTFRQTMNSMGDLTLDEFAARYVGSVEGTYAPPPGADYVHWSEFLPSDDGLNLRIAAADLADVDNIDMRETGCTTDAKNQDPCEGCVIFAEMTRLEYLYCMKGCGKKMFSEKEALDCDSTTTCANGSLTGSTWAYVDNAGGISAGPAYPWPKGINNAGVMDGHSCQKHPKYPIKIQQRVGFEKADGETDFERDVWRAMKALKEDLGPVVAILKLSRDDIVDIQFITGKEIISNNQGCLYKGDKEKKITNHAVTIFGMGTEIDDEGTKRDYWLVKNSWGVGWNPPMRGYFKILRNHNTYCIGDYPGAVFIDCKFNCRDPNPCTALNRRNDLYYFPSSKGKRYYVQCGISKGMCWTRKCPKKGTIWNARANGCVQPWWARINKKRKQKNKKNKNNAS